MKFETSNESPPLLQKDEIVNEVKSLPLSSFGFGLNALITRPTQSLFTMVAAFLLYATNSLSLHLTVKRDALNLIP